MTTKPALLIISSVFPFPRSSGQQQRVYYTLRALRPHFHLTFLTTAPRAQIGGVTSALLEHCDNAIVLPSLYQRGAPFRLAYRALGGLYSLLSGLKFSNYLTGRVELTPLRVEQAVRGLRLDAVLYEYWHAADTVRVFQGDGIPCVLDTHNILWKSLERQLQPQKGIPRWWKERTIRKYRAHEERAWNRDNALIALNASEYQAMREKTNDAHIFHTPMGINLADWPCAWQPATPPRLAYYGGLGSRHNQQDALDCYEKIMPAIWRQIPNAELWIVGSDPPNFLRALAEKDRRVIVTGFVEHPQNVLQTVSALLCPWSGTYGFRSRLIEVMALGVPVIASPDAVYGMDMKIGQGIFLEDSHEGIAARALRLLANKTLLEQQSRLARKQMEESFSYEATYARLAEELLKFVRASHKTREDQ